MSLPTLRITPPHLDTLDRAGIPMAAAKEWGIFSVVVAADLDGTDLAHHRDKNYTGLCFPLRMPDGSVTYQLRLDDAHITPERGKYIQASGLGAILNVPASRSHLVGVATKVIITEGTKQTIAATLASDDDVLIIGIQGCHNFSRAGVPLAEIAKLVSPSAEVTIIFDADWNTNADVWQAASDLKSHLEDTIGVPAVKIASVPGGGKLGLDDAMGTIDPSARPAMLARLVAKAGPKLGRKPAKKVKTVVKTNSKLTVHMDQGVIMREAAASPEGFGGGQEVALAAAARIVEAEAHIDEEAGEASSQRLKLEVAIRVEGSPVPVTATVKVESSKLSSLGDWLDRLPGGLGVRIPRSSRPDDDVANAIREFSTDIVNVSVVPHTGWTFDTEDATWRWCDGEGAIGAADKVTRLRGEPASRDFQNIRLPDSRSIPATELIAHVRSFVMARDLFNDSKMFSWDVAVAGWGLSFLGVTPNAAIAFFGPPSSGKSTVAQCLASSLNPGWAPRTGSAMATFNSRPAGMDLLPNGLQNCFLHVDDLKPESDKASMSAAYKAFDALLRRAHGSGGAVRGEVNRSSDSLGVRKVDGAAPFMIITGEQIPTGEGFAESGLDRALFIPVEPNSQLKSNETLHQFEELGKRGNLRYVTSAYLSWLAKLIDRTSANEVDDAIEPSRRFAAWQDSIEKQRSALTSGEDGTAIFPPEVKASNRAALLAASLLTGYRHVLTFAVHMKAITGDEAEGLVAAFGAALYRQIVHHTTHVMGGNATATEQALARLRNAVSSRQVSIDPTEEGNRPIIGVVREFDGVKCVVINHAAAADALRYTGGARGLQTALAEVSLMGKDKKNTRTLNINGARVQVCVIPMSAWDPGEDGADDGLDPAAVVAAAQGF